MGLGGTARATPGLPEFVKWYAVQSSYQGQPENLSEIAARFLGTATRANDIFNLNVGRQQPDGAALSKPDELHAGWLLVLPWDAVGTGVMYGALPTTSPPQGSTGSAVPVKPHTGTNGTPRSGTAITVVPSVRPSTAVPGGSAGPCLTAAASSSQSDWATLRLAPDQAWSQTRGKGQMVAVIDSGVDGSQPQLAGHLALGADIVNGSGQGDTDCLGTGTAMAGIIAAQPNQSSGTVGIAPEAVILPIRIVTASPSAQPSDEATAIQVAVSAGATVLALGSYVNVVDPRVTEAVGRAVEHNVVVVYPAPAAAPGVPVPSSLPRAAGPAGAGGVLSVGAVGVDGRLGANYQPGSVNVVAPGLNVMTLSITGTGTAANSGTQYAVAFTAGEVALVRAAHPNLTAAQVVERIELTSDSQGGGTPDSAYGWGLINPAVAVNKVLGEGPSQQAPYTGGAASASGSSSSTGRNIAIVIVLLVGLAAGTLLTIRIRHVIRSGPADRDRDRDAGTDTGDGDRTQVLAGGSSGGFPHKP
jgi:hypothetical protein